MHNAVSKFKNYITQVTAFIVNILIEPLPVLFHEPAGYFGWNGSSFLSYRLLKTFQSLGTMLVYLGFEVVPGKKITQGKIWRMWRPPYVTTKRMKLQNCAKNMHYSINPAEIKTETGILRQMVTNM
jgi:hypothetical protein